MAESANHIFLPWVQPGIAANIPDSAADTLTAKQLAFIALTVKLEVNAEEVAKTARLYGPGDVTGIDPQQVVRVEPRHRTTDFEPNYFPAIEFDRPDFPWLFTPAKADAQGRLRPWLCLVVVRRQPGVELRPGGGLPLPVLEIKDPARPGDELPDLSESHFWAHAQVTGADKGQLKTVLASDPARSVSRLVCPRRLDPATDYIACVVPAFDVGCKAGLDKQVEPADLDRLEPSWRSGTQAPDGIMLPVYYSWEFRTAADSDFEELVRRLKPRPLPAEVGKRPMDISRPGFPMQQEPGAPATTLGLEGALRVLGSQPDAWPDAVRVPFQTTLAEILNTPWKLATGEGGEHDPLVAPPVYGCWQAAVHTLGTRAAPPPFWLDELNLDPRHRATAALGTRVVQDLQEQLVASAWEQLGDQRVNQRLRQAQLSRAVNTIYYEKFFRRFSQDAFFKIVAPAQSRLVLEERAPNQPPNAPPVKTLLVQKLAQSPVPSSAVSAPLRRISRPRGALNRPFAQAGTAGIRAVLTSFRADDSLRASGTNAPDRGAVTIDKVSVSLPAQFTIRVPKPKQGPFGVLIPGFIDRQIPNPLHHTFRLTNLAGSVIASKPPTPAAPTEFLQVAKAHQDYLGQIFPRGGLFFIATAFTTLFRADGALVSLNPTQTIRDAALASLKPDRTVRESVLTGLTIQRPQQRTDDPLDPVMDAPTFPQPMYEGLRDLSQDYLLPGLEHVPPDTVQLLETNAKFIESFMVGLNAEMSRELLWRGFPTDQRGTYFRQFWDTTAAGAQAQLDITPIHEWGLRALGTTAIGAGGDKLVLLIRGELMRRYPNTVIYAVKAVERLIDRESPTVPGTFERVTVRDLTNPAVEAHPLFRGTLEPDVTFVGFPLTRAEVVAGPGWYFVLQEQPTEPRFGLDDDPFSEGETGEVPELATWNELNWAHLAPSAEALRQLSHVSVNNVQLTPTQPTTGIWGRNSAHMAYITKQRPARVAIHATELMP